jgi:predicted nucleotidyltransferase
MRLYLSSLPEGLKPKREVLQRCLEAFGKALPVHKVLLFGSYARGDHTQDSDVDLCVVADRAENQLEAARLLRYAIRDIRAKPPFTLIPITPELLSEKQAARDHFFATVLEEGILVAAQD